MTGAQRTARRLGLWVAVAGGLAFLAAGCTEYRVERQGKDAGEHVCDLKNADSADEAKSAVDDVQKDLEDAREIVGRPVGEDVDDIQNNLRDLVTHVSNGQDDLVAQDIAVIRRNIEAAVDAATGSTQHFYEGVQQGLGECSD